MMAVVSFIPPRIPAKRPNSNKAVAKINRLAPIIVKSDLVVIAYTTSEPVMARVMMAAERTISGSLMEHA